MASKRGTVNVCPVARATHSWNLYSTYCVIALETQTLSRIPEFTCTMGSICLAQSRSRRLTNCCLSSNNDRFILEAYFQQLICFLRALIEFTDVCPGSSEFGEHRAHMCPPNSSESNVGSPTQDYLLSCIDVLKSNFGLLSIITTWPPRIYASWTKYA